MRAGTNTPRDRPCATQQQSNNKHLRTLDYSNFNENCRRSRRVFGAPRGFWGVRVLCKGDDSIDRDQIFGCG